MRRYQGFFLFGVKIMDYWTKQMEAEFNKKHEQVCESITYMADTMDNLLYIMRRDEKLTGDQYNNLHRKLTDIKGHICG
jgi:hypothetical protein